MNAQNLIECLEAAAYNMGVELEDLAVVFRDGNWNIWQVEGTKYDYLQDSDGSEMPAFVLRAD